MEVKQITQLSDRLPLLSSSIAFGINKEAVEKYIQAYDEEENRKNAAEARYNQAILTSKWRDSDRPPPGKRERNGQPLNWAWCSRYFFKAECRKAGLRTKSAGVVPGDRWLVGAWVHRRDQFCRYETNFREPLPLPKDNEFTDCSLTENEWLVIFWSMVDLNPEYQKRSPVPPPSDGRFKDSDDIRKFTRSTSQRAPIRRLVEELKSVQDAELHRFEAGRRVVIEVLFRECLRRSLQRACGAKTKSRFDLVVSGDDPELAKPKFLPAGWKSPYWPKADTVPALRQWLACTLQMLEHWQESMPATEDANDIVSVSMARQAGDDAWRLARHVRDQHGISLLPKKPADSSRLANVMSFLDELGLAISTPTGTEPTASDGKPGKQHVTKRRTNFSPWIGAAELIPIMQTNNIKATNRRGYSDRSITRTKKRWGSESQAGSNNQRFRFKLSRLRTLGINYPHEWNMPDSSPATS